MPANVFCDSICSTAEHIPVQFVGHELSTEWPGSHDGDAEVQGAGEGHHLQDQWKYSDAKERASRFKNGLETGKQRQQLEYEKADSRVERASEADLHG